MIRNIFELVLPLVVASAIVVFAACTVLRNFRPSILGSSTRMAVKEEKL